jgi:hypothetical protein
MTHRHAGGPARHPGDVFSARVCPTLLARADEVIE